jgi:hypothetical protein
MFGSVERVGSAGVFGQVMGLVAITVGFFTLGAYLGRDFSGGAAIICFILGFLSIIGLNFARRSERLAITMLFAAGPAGSSITRKCSPPSCGRQQGRQPCSSARSGAPAMRSAATSPACIASCSSRCCC